MSLSVSSQAQYLYSVYSLKNSYTYSEYAVDASAVSKENYNVSNVTNALNAMSKSDSVYIGSVSNINSYVQNTYKLRQLDSYESLSSSSSSWITRLLTGEASSDDICALIGAESAIAADSVISSLSSDYSTASSYTSYLSESGSIINLLV